MTTDMFPQLVEQDKAQAELNATSRRREAVAYHIHSIRSIWPQWDGPKVGGRCEVGTPIVHSITHNAQKYHYMAPCRIDSISADGETLEVTVDYEPGSICTHYNGERLRLDILDVWVPYRDFAIKTVTIKEESK